MNAPNDVTAYVKQAVSKLRGGLCVAKIMTRSTVNKLQQNTLLHL